MDKSHEKILTLALKRFDTCEKAESKNRELALEDKRFALGNQWESEDRRFRESDNRLCLTINRVPAFVRQVVNDIRQSRQRINVSPIDGHGDPETAKIYSGIIRAIEGGCNADAAYDWAAESAVSMGWGYFRITTEYSNDADFNQRILIKRIKNPFTVYFDPDSDEPDGSDAEFAFVISSMERSDFEAKFPKAASEWQAGGTTGTGMEGWYLEDRVRVAEYWVVTTNEMDVSMLLDGSLAEGVAPDAIATRKITQKYVTQYIITGAEILSETTWPGRYIPIIPVYGEEADIDGETILKGMVRDLRDSQRAYNFARSVEVERAGLAPKVPWIGPKGSFTDPKWKSANRKNYPYLEYDNQGIPPFRIEPPDVSPGLTQLQATAAMELRDITGIHEAGMGEKGPEIAGIAIAQRRGESDVSNFHYFDNLSRSRRHCGRILVDLIPRIYSEKQMIQIVNPDGQRESIVVNGEWINPKTGRAVNYNLKLGAYDAEIDTGPGYATQRQEAAAAMERLIEKNPQLISLIGDLMIKSMDWPDSQDIAERMKLMLPPEIAKNENPQIAQLLNQSQQQIQQMQQAMGQIQQYAQALEQQLRNKDGELKIKAGELQRKYQEMMQDYAHDMTKLELDARRNVPGAVI